MNNTEEFRKVFGKSYAEMDDEHKENILLMIASQFEIIQNYVNLANYNIKRLCEKNGMEFMQMADILSDAEIEELGGRKKKYKS